MLPLAYTLLRLVLVTLSRPIEFRWLSLTELRAARFCYFVSAYRMWDFRPCIGMREED